MTESEQRSEWLITLADCEARTRQTQPAVADMLRDLRHDLRTFWSSRPRVSDEALKARLGPTVLEQLQANDDDEEIDTTPFCGDCGAWSRAKCDCPDRAEND